MHQLASCHSAFLAGAVIFSSQIKNSQPTGTERCQGSDHPPTLGHAIPKPYEGRGFNTTCHSQFPSNVIPYKRKLSEYHALLIELMSPFKTDREASGNTMASQFLGTEMMILEAFHKTQRITNAS